MDIKIRMEGLDIKMRMGRKEWLDIKIRMEGLDIKMRMGRKEWLDIKMKGIERIVGHQEMGKKGSEDSWF